MVSTAGSVVKIWKIYWPKLYRNRLKKSVVTKLIQTHPDSLADPVHFPSPVVLAYEGSNRDGKGADDHPEDHINLAISGPGRNGVGSQAVDAGLDDDVGSGVHGGLKTRRKTDSDDPF